MSEENTTNSDPNIDENASQRPPVAKNVIQFSLEDEMKKSYLDYAMSVIVSRALPDIRDGLKPVHRRILYAMHSLGLTRNKPHKKSARIIGEVIGKYHPHGDSAVYDTLVRMAQHFAMRYTLIDGQGNFGSVDGDRAAAMRYTEARMQKISDEILADIEKDTVDFKENFDGEEREPSVLPTKIPLLLINGSVGIAVGMATNIPPHNLNEICKAAQSLIKNPDIEETELIKEVSGPDFPTGGIIYGNQGIALAYKTGRGKIKIRAKTHIEESTKKNAIILDEIPYQVNKADLVIEIANHVKNKTIEGISDIRDESDRDGMRVVIELKKEANTDIILNQLFKHTRCQVTFGMNLLCLVDGIPKTLPIKDILEHFITHRKQVVVRRTQFDLTKAEKQAHILIGLKKSIENLDKTVDIVKKAESAKVAKEQLMSTYDIDDIQAQAILDMKLQRLTGLERDKIVNDYQELMTKIEELKGILRSETQQFQIIYTELEEEIEKFGDERKTAIMDAPIDDADIDLEDLITPEETVVTVTHSGYIKRLPLDTYKAQGRGGKGIIATGTKEEDFVEKIFIANTHTYLLCFTNFGQVHWLKVYNIPEGSRQARGKAIINLVPVDQSKGEVVTTIIPVKEFTEGNYLFLITKKGIVKKTDLLSYSRPRNGGVRGVILDEGDELTHALLTNGNDKVMLATASGLASRFSENDVRASGRVTRGMRGINLADKDKVIGAMKAKEQFTILTITKNGYGKRTPIEEYRLIRRGGKGVINIQCSERNGEVVGIARVSDDDELMIISKKGITIRVRAADISVIGRNTQGVRVMRLSEEDEVVSVAKVIADETQAEEEDIVEDGSTSESKKIVQEEDTGEIKESEDLGEDLDKED